MLVSLSSAHFHIGSIGLLPSFFPLKMFEISLPPKFVSSIALSSLSCLNLVAPKIMLRERRNGDGQSLGGACEVEKNVGIPRLSALTY